MVKVSLLLDDGVGESRSEKISEGVSEGVSDEDSGFSSLDLLEVTQQSTIIDLFFDNDCVCAVPPYLVEAK